MTTSLMFAERTTGFKMRRASLLNGSFVTDLDPLAEQRIAELDALLGKHLFTPLNADEAEAEVEAAADLAANGARVPQHAREARALLARAFLPWRPAVEIVKAGWPANSLVDALSDAEDDEAALSLSDHIDLVPELADLKYDFATRVEQGLLKLDANARAVLQGRFNIIDFLVARAYHLGGLRDPKALYNYIVGNREGVRAVVGYVAVGAARALIAKQKLKVPKYHEDGSAFTLRVRAKAISLSDSGFEKAVKAIADDLMYNAEANKLLEKSKLGPVPDDIKPALIRLIQGFKIPLTADNIDVFLPSLITQAYEDMAEDSIDEPAESESEAEDRGYQVQFRDAVDPEVDINREAVHFAAQLFHAMVLGEELGVFDAFQYLLHSRMIVGGGMEVRDKKLRADLRLYTLSNQFRDLGRPGRPQEERTRPSERKMFARMVFAQGEGQLMEGMPENTEFRQLWEVLMLESARYLERAQESFNPGSFVSKQNVMQAVEDLQYNLSTHCVGWPQVMAPAIDAELNFVLARFIQNEKIAQQVLPAGGSWKRVIDKLNAERPKKRAVPAAALLYAKATQGLQILEAVADYSPAEFEDDGPFSGFISLVDAYITTESKLQSRGGPAYRAAEPDEDDADQEPARPYGSDDEAAPAANDDEWDF